MSRKNGRHPRDWLARRRGLLRNARDLGLPGDSGPLHSLPIISFVRNENALRRACLKSLIWLASALAAFSVVSTATSLTCIPNPAVFDGGGFAAGANATVHCEGFAPDPVSDLF